MSKRKLSEIAQEIEATWPNVNFAAKPYLDAMQMVDSPEDVYHCVNGKSIVLYFLSNAATWRGEDARRIKAELKEVINYA